ncbi:MAG: YdcF family protein [Pseudomonadota bacterium]
METAFFAVAKLVWLLIRPETLLLLLFAASLGAAWRGWRRAALASGGVALGLALCVAVFPLARVLYTPLEARFPASPEISTPAGILVLGGGEEFGPPLGQGQPQVNDAGERYLAAIALARRHPSAWVMFAGGRATIEGGPAPNAALSARIFTDSGISPDRIVLENSSRNTAENAANALPLRPAGSEAGPWLLVTSAWHMPRAVGAFCTAGWEGIVPWPTDFRSGRLTPGWQFAKNLSELNGAAKEWVGLLGYRLGGRTSRVLPEGCPPE